MNNEILILSITAATLGFVHTLFGPDHYLPFIVLSKARNWSTAKTIWITTLCGLGHVASSVLLGAIGIGFGIGLSKLEFFEAARGDWAAWAFIAFGLIYLLWALRQLKLKKGHGHSHPHSKDGKSLTPWILFMVFVLGPCEPLIPLLMFPAAQASTMGIVIVTSVFGLVTIATMVGVVMAVNYGVTFFKVNKLEKYTQVIAGGTIALSGVLILSGL